MTRRRLLADTLVDMGASALDAAAALPGLAISELALTLPLEVAVVHAGNDIELVGDVPRTVTRTRFDAEPARLAVVWRRGAPA